MMDFEKLTGAESSQLTQARNGNIEPLTAKIRSGDMLSDAERQFIADRLEGKIKLKPGRQTRVDSKDIDAARIFERLENSGWKKEAIYAEIAARFSESDRNVKKRILRGRQSWEIEKLIQLLILAANGNELPD